jgi:hypothetical protein
MADLHNRSTTISTSPAADHQQRPSLQVRGGARGLHTTKLSDHATPLFVLPAQGLSRHELSFVRYTCESAYSSASACSKDQRATRRSGWVSQLDLRLELLARLPSFLLTGATRGVQARYAVVSLYWALVVIEQQQT